MLGLSLETRVPCASPFAELPGLQGFKGTRPPPPPGCGKVIGRLWGGGGLVPPRSSPASFLLNKVQDLLTVSYSHAFRRLTNTPFILVSF